MVRVCVWLPWAVGIAEVVACAPHRLKTKLALGHAMHMSTMQSSRCFSARALGCLLANLVQDRDTRGTADWERWQRVWPLLNSSKHIEDGLDLVVLGASDSSHDAFAVLDGNHRLLALSALAHLWESPVCASMHARAAAPATYGVRCRNVSAVATQVTATIGLGPRVGDPAWRAYMNLRAGVVCPESRIRSVGCLRMGDHDEDTDPTYALNSTAGHGTQ